MKKILLSILVLSCISIKAKPQKTLQEKLGYSKDSKRIVHRSQCKTLRHDKTEWQCWKEGNCAIRKKVACCIKASIQLLLNQRPCQRPGLGER